VDLVESPGLGASPPSIKLKTLEEIRQKQEVPITLMPKMLSVKAGHHNRGAASTAGEFPRTTKPPQSQAKAKMVSPASTTNASRKFLVLAK
jgi:hypothetical protein